jgi:hypothetical protein
MAMIHTVDRPKSGLVSILPLRPIFGFGLKLKVGTGPWMAPGILVFLRWRIVRGIYAAIRRKAKST